jgi:hypothetical protein
VSKLKAIIDSGIRSGIDKPQPPRQMPDEAARQAIRPTEKTIDDFSNEDSFYRIVDEDAYIDLVNSGAVRTNFGNKPGSTIKDKLASRPTRYPSFSKGSANKTYAEGKPNHYIIETKDPSIKPSTEGRHGKGTTQFPTDSTGVHLESLPGEAVQVYRHIGDGQYRLVYDQGKVTPKATNAETKVAAPLGIISIPIAAAIAAGTMTPQEAQAGPVSKALAELAKRADAGDEASLMFLHNTSAEKLQRVQDMGGMPMPSIAITDKDIPFENFGDITLVGKPESFDPKSSSLNQAFSADAYTVRAPRPVRIAKKGAGKRFQELYGADAKELDVYAADTVANVWDLEKKGDVREDKYDQVVRWFDDRSGPIFLKDKGIPFNKESRQDIDEKLQPFRQSGEFKQWTDDAVDELFEPNEYFVANPDRDYYTQKAKLKPYTADEITKVMKRSAGRGGEGGISVGSPGSVRAAYSEKLTSLDAMRKRKDQLSGDIGIEKSEIENLLFDLGDALKPYYKYDPSGFTYRDAVSEFMTEGATRGLKRSADFVGFENIPKDLMSELEGFQQILKKAPTEYFESKPKRVVQLNEFAGAIVPEGTKQSTIDLLTRQGLEIERYTDDAQRLEARRKFKNLLFQLPPVAVTTVLAGIAAGAPGRAEAGPIKEAISKGIKLFHGSPYNFPPVRELEMPDGAVVYQSMDDAVPEGARVIKEHPLGRFDMSKIGTGEGAQAYSRGLYFAEREATGQSYRDTLSRDNLAQRAKDNQSYDTLVGLGLDESPELGTFSIILSEADGDMARAIQDSMTPRYPDDPLPAFAQSMADAMKSGRLPASIELPTLNKGSMYEVNIAATPDEFIDWDLPLDEQSESVMNALNKTDWYKYAEEGAYEAAGNRGDNPYGMDLVRWLEEDGAEDAVQMLKDAGIKGVQYADAQTRFGKGPKTKNYVVYDDKLIDIIKKYGVSVPIAVYIAEGIITPEEAQAVGFGSVVKKSLSGKTDEIQQGIGSLPAGDEMVTGGDLQFLMNKLVREQSVKQAKEQGYDLDNVMYHASKQDIEEFVPGYSDGLVFLTPNKEFANNWLGKGKFQERQGGTGAIEGVRAEKKRWREEADKILKSLPEDQRQQYYEEILNPQQQQLLKDERLADGAIYPVVTRTKKPFVPSKNVDVLEELYSKEYLDAPFGSGFPTYRDALKDGNYLLYEKKEVVDFLKSKGYDSMFLKESSGADKPFTTLAVFDPNNIRSVNAKFDPEKKDSPQILASAPFATGITGLGAMAALPSEEAEAGGMGVTSRAMPDEVAFKAPMPDEVAFKAPREPRRIPPKQPPGIASLAGQLGLGAMSEIAGAIFGGLAGAAEYGRGSGPSMGGMAGAPATAESIRNINEGVSGYVGDLYDAGPEAQALGQQIMQGIGETIAPIAEYAMEGPITDEYGINMLPLLAQKLGIPLYELLERVYSMMPELEQEAAKSGADAFL